MRGRDFFAALAASALGGLGLAGTATAAEPRADVVRSFDSTPIVVNYFEAPGLDAGQRRPTILVGHGWGGSGAEDPTDGSVAPYLEAGYNVLTWDARGFGESGGTVQIDDPRFEARDASALVTYVARQPSAKLDARRDPVIGMSGGSYGGGIQLITAARDHRIDAITPDIAWNTLNRSLYQRGSIKLGWDLALIGLGIPTSVAEGVFSPAGVQTGNQSDFFYDAVTSGVTTGTLSPAVQRWFRRHGPKQYLKRIKAPTLITQGTVDTLFTLTESVRNFRALSKNGIPLKMTWHCGGHGVCLTDAGPEGHLDARRVAWFDRYLKGRDVGTGPRFEWVDEQGRYHRSNRFRLAGFGRASGEGSGQIPLTPGPTTIPNGGLVFAQPAPVDEGPVLNVPIEGVEVGDELLGAPKLTLRYSATGSGVPPARTDRTFLYAQIVDESRGPLGPGSLVVGNQATPIPIELETPSPGQPTVHKLSLPLETVASLAGEQGYSLQIVAQSSLYDFQRAAGLVDVRSARIELPTSR